MTIEVKRYPDKPWKHQLFLRGSNTKVAEPGDSLSYDTSAEVLGVIRDGRVEIVVYNANEVHIDWEGVEIKGGDPYKASVYRSAEKEDINAILGQLFGNNAPVRWVPGEKTK